MIKYPSYDRCIVNLVNSCMKFAGGEPLNATLPEADDVLKKSGARNAVVLILDGLGKYNIETSLKPESFLRRQMKGCISSVFPTTTVASTTSADSGLYPSEHCRIGWSMHFDEVDKNVNVFLNTGYDNKPVSDKNIPNEAVPYVSITERMKRSGLKAETVSHFGTVKIGSFEELCEELEDICASEGSHYIYSYWHEPDHSMHLYGVESDEVKKIAEELSARLEILCKSLRDTVIFVTADHGHVDSRKAYIGDFPDILETLKEFPSVEPRALAFRVKEGMNEEFIKAFRKHFSEEEFELYTGDEVRAKKIFGPKESEKLKKYVGDYFAVAVGDMSLFYSKSDYEQCIGIHAGLTKREMEIPFTPIICPYKGE